MDATDLRAPFNAPPPPPPQTIIVKYEAMKGIICKRETTLKRGNGGVKKYFWFFKLGIAAIAQ